MWLKHKRTIGQEHDKEENTLNKSSLDVVVQDIDEYILTEVKRIEHCYQPS